MKTKDRLHKEIFAGIHISVNRAFERIHISVNGPFEGPTDERRKHVIVC